MKKIFIIAIVALFTCFNFVESKAQDGPCIPDCPDSYWIPEYPNNPSEITFELPICEEDVTAFYRWRIACETWQDYYIEKIRMNSSTCLDDEFGGDLGAFLAYITEQLIIANPAGFRPNEGEPCEMNWRVLKGSCWEWDYIVSVPKISNKDKKKDNKALYGCVDRIIPCTTNDCCLEFYMVCWENGERVITQTGYLPPEDPECEGEATQNCQPVCGSVYNR